jgi:hypothetical protein
MASGKWQIASQKRNVDPSPESGSNYMSWHAAFKERMLAVKSAA